MLGGDAVSGVQSLMDFILFFFLWISKDLDDSIYYVDDSIVGNVILGIECGFVLSIKLQCGV